jgi:23S rRNA pseudouridine2605 synthase
LKGSSAAKPVRIHVYLARCGIASRRKCEQYITEGRVKKNGKTVTRLGETCFPDDTIQFDNETVLPEQNNIYIALHKPRGYICANADPFDRPLALDLIKEAGTYRLFHVGRLDLNSSGLIFFTNDGEFAKIVSHPSWEIEKEYIVETREIITEKLLSQFKRGMHIEGVEHRIKQYRLTTARKAVITLNEGKNREIRKLFQAVGILVTTIHRTRIGPVTIDGIPPGSYRYVSDGEIAAFMELQKWS